MADIPIGRRSRRQGRIVKWNGKRWVPVTKSKVTPKFTPKGNPSARRADAAARKERAAQGTKGDKVRTGQPKGSANRYYGADRVEKAVRRAQRSTAVRTAARVLKGTAKGAARLLAGRDDGSGSALMAAKLTSDTINAARGSTAKERNKPKSKPKSGNKVTGQADYTKQQQRLSDARSNPRYSRKPAATKPTTTKPPASKPPVSKPPAKKSTASTYKKHGSDLHIGRHKTLADHRKAVAERKKKKKPQSNANKAGWQGNRNF